MFKKITSFLFGAVLLTTPVLAQTPPASYNTTLFGALHPAASFGGRYSALWGYAAPDGREYALLGGFFGTHIVDVTTQPITEVAFIEGPPSGWREMKTSGHYAYVVTEGGGGLQIIDLSQLPNEATLVRSDTTFFRTGHTISQYKNFLFINGANPDALSNGGSLILDIGADPVNPRFVSVWRDRYVHDATIRNDTMYAAAINNGRLDIIALGADMMNPTYVTGIEYPGAGTHNADVTQDGSYIMTTDEVNATPKTLKVWDRRDPNNITKVADYTPAPGEVIHNVHTKGRLAFVSWYTAGTRIIDMTLPSEPAEVGYYDTYPGAGADYAGNWEVYPYLPSGKILASDMQSGLHVFTFNGARRGSIHGVVRDAATGDPVPNAKIRVSEFGRTITADAQGRYRYAGAVDTLDFTASALNYKPGSGALHLSESDTEYDIRLVSLPLAKFSISPVDAVSGEPIANFSYHIAERPFIDVRSSTNPEALALPQDSTYHIYIGSWGYVPRLIEVRNADGVVMVALDKGYVDNAELDLGWSLMAANDNALGGRWERGIPILTDLPDGRIAQPGFDHTMEPGVQAFITGIANSQGGIGANDVDDGITTLTSPPMDLTSYEDPIINSAIWYSRDLREDAVNDTLMVSISPDGGETWTMMARITESPQIWREYMFRVRDFITPGGRTLFRIEASDLHDQSLVEAGLDAFAVVEGEPSAVPEAPVAGLEGVSSALYPNPFSGTAVLDITLPAAQQRAQLELFDGSGRHVAILHEGALPGGTSSFTIDGSSLPSGRYTWRLLLDNGATLSGAATLLR